MTGPYLRSTQHVNMVGVAILCTWLLFVILANECLDSARRTGQTDRQIDRQTDRENRVDTTSVGLAHARPNDSI